MQVVVSNRGLSQSGAANRRVNLTGLPLRVCGQHIRSHSCRRIQKPPRLPATPTTGLVDRNNGDDTADTRQQFIRVKLRKPMGMVLAEKASTVFVEEMTSGGNADKSGKVRVGDVVSKCSAYVLKSGKEGDFEREGYGRRPYTNWEPIMFDCEGQDFKTVMSAISSNNDRWGIFDVTLELRREKTN